MSSMRSLTVCTVIIYEEYARESVSELLCCHSLSTYPKYRYILNSYSKILGIYTALCYARWDLQNIYGPDKGCFIAARHVVVVQVLIEL